MIMTFGKHRGKRIEEIPDDYLFWVLGNCDPQAALRLEIHKALGLLGPTTVPALPVSDLLDPWYRQLAREFHPDAGGSHEAMVAVNRGRELMAELSGEAAS